MPDKPLEPTDIRTRDGQLVPLRAPDPVDLAWSIAGAWATAAVGLAAVATRLIWPTPKY